MRTKLTKLGNELALIIEQPLLDQLNIDADTELEISTDGQELHLRPARKDVDYERRVKESLRRVNERHGEALRKLAE